VESLIKETGMRPHENVENAKVAKERLGHSTIVMTLNTCTHVLPDIQQGVADRIENLLFKTGT
jgi:aspartate/glutamate racemase